MSFYALSGLINGITSIVLGFFIFKKNFNSKVNRVFSFFCFSIALWSFAYFFWLNSQTAEVALWWSRIFMAGAIFIPVFFLHFVVLFLEARKIKPFLKWIYLLFIVFLIFDFTPWFIKGIKSFPSFKFWPEPGIAFHIFLFFWCLAWFLAFVLLIKKLYFDGLNDEKRKQAFDLFIGVFIGATGGITNYFLWYDIPIPPIGNILVSIFIFFTFYAITKYNLMNLKAVLSEVLVIVFSLLLLGNIFVANNLIEYIWNIFLFIIFLFFGASFIKSIYRRIRTREKIEKYSRRLKRANTKLKELDKQKTEFMSLAAHQLRAPLTSVKGFASMILEDGFGKAPKKVKEVAEKIYDASEAMSDSVDDYLNISRIEQGRMEYDMEELDFYELAQEVKEELKPMAYKKKLKLTISSDKYKKYPIKADHSKLRQVIYNFTENAIKYTPKGKVNLHVSRQKGYVVLAIKDTGLGMSQTTIKKLFQRYSRAKDNQGVSGTGLGLFIARKMIEAQKGKVWAESPGEGKGSTFFIKLPLLKKKRRNKK